MSEHFLGPFAILLVVWTAKASDALLEFVFLYPLFMSFVWMSGALYFYLHWERRDRGPGELPALREIPFVSILVPCHDEEENLVETIDSLLAQNYPDFEVIAIDDGSRDATGVILDRLAAENPRLRVVHLARNQGKAMALRMGALVARGEYLVCVDGDALLHPNAAAWLVKPLIDNPRVGAVTGNPRIRTRSTLLGNVQVGEFSSIVGLIKRAQRVYGNVFTVSGVVASFRRAALHRIGYWSLDMVTEDIDISWALQLDHWSIQYEPNALCWILMPETYRGLWRQRLRWAQGGAEVFLKHIRTIWRWRRRRMWLLITEYIVSVAWAYAFAFSIVLWAIGKLVEMPGGLNVPTILPPAFWGLMLATVCLLQFVVAMLIERRYEERLTRSMVWVIWYPLAFWLVMLLTSLAGFPKALFKRRGKRAVWKSPDRGIRGFSSNPS
jgi:biofilm PGA synthesis N-glycosyltransferase PgaC